MQQHVNDLGSEAAKLTEAGLIASGDLDTLRTRLLSAIEQANGYSRRRDEHDIDAWLSKSLESGARLAQRWAKGGLAITPPISTSHASPSETSASVPRR